MLNGGKCDKIKYIFESEEKQMAQITKDTIIGDILDMNMDTAPFFLEMGMHCLGCPSARGETIGQACEVHGVSADELVKKLNDFMNNN